jgi:protein arginine kinase
MEGRMNNLVVSNRVSISRNFADLPFPNKMNDEQRDTNLARVSRVLYGGREIFRQITKEENECLNDLGLDSSMLDSALENGDAVIFENSTCDTYVVAGDLDGIKIIRYFDDVQDEPLKELYNISDLLFKDFPAAYDKDFGFLTAKPMQAGSGAEISVLVHLPVSNSLRQIPATIKRVQEEHKCDLLPLENDKNDSCLYVLSCKAEQDKKMPDNLKEALMVVADQEKMLAKKVLSNPRSSLYDQAYRAYGILKYARRITGAEFLYLWSLLRMGAENEILPIDIETVDALLSLNNKEYNQFPVNAGDINFLRADEIRRRLEE